MTLREFHIFHDKIPLMLILSCCERPLAKQESMISNIHDGALFRTGNFTCFNWHILSLALLLYSKNSSLQHPIFNMGSQFQRTIINFHIDMHYLRCFWSTMVYYGPTKNFQVPKPHGDMTWHDQKKNSDVPAESKAPRRASMATQPMPRRRERFRSRFQRIHSDRRGLGRSPDGNLTWTT